MNNLQNNFQRELFTIIKEKWFSLYGLLATLFIELFILLPYLWNNFGAGFSCTEWIAISVIVMITFSFWMFSRRYPKNIKNKVGIVVAITTEDKKEYIRLKSDLISKLKEVIKIQNKEDAFNIVELPEYFSAKIKDRASSIQALRKSRGHFLIYGSCKFRFEHGKKCYYMNLEAAVTHRPIPLIISDTFSKEFAELFPRKIIFPVEDEISGFEITREWIGLVARYIIGIAAFLSYDFDLSFELFKELHQELKSIDTNILQIKKIKTRIPKWISMNALRIANRKYFQYRKTKSKPILNEIKPFLDILKNFDPNNYSAHLLRGIYLFLVERNIEEAKKEIEHSKNNLDATWRYSEAFLYAYEGNLDKAERSYKKAFLAEVTPDIIFQTEEFIYDVLEIEAGKCQLWYCVGMINWKAKGDNILAKVVFEKFLSCGNEQLYFEQKRKVKEYLRSL